ncbi:MAG TPA: GAF domain-containing protein, partial [Candidatus Limnocylindrales bacterium]
MAKRAAPAAAPDDQVALRARVAELESREAERERAATVQGALYRIADAASSIHEMAEFYPAMHAIVGELMNARNFYIALYDEERQLLNFPYYVDSVDPDVPDPTLWEPIGTGDAAGITAYAVRRGEPLLLDTRGYRQLVESGVIQESGAQAEGESGWLGVPLRSEGKTLGIVVVQDYEHRLSEDDKELLIFVGQHIATALSRARAIEETRQRNAELAVINEIGAALAAQLDFQAIIELVGAKVREIFAVDTMAITLYDEAAGRITFPFSLDEGARYDMPSRDIGEGLTSQVIEAREPVRFDSGSEAENAGAINVGTYTEAWLGVPILAGERVIGTINLESIKANAFDESDVRLLSTVASSMGVALENARLFDETKRLLTETDQRAAELALINEIGSALAAQLDFDAIVEVVGDRLWDIFEAQARDMFVAIHEKSTNLISFPYEIENGKRIQSEPIELGQGLTSIVIGTNRPLRFGSDAAQVAAGAIIPANTGESGSTSSWLGVPIRAGGQVIGVIVLGHDEEDAYSDADERLVSTVASSMGVALANARLFDETKRLLAETDQRAAELAIVNEIGEALARQLDFAAIIELVGERVRSIFQTGSIFIALYDPATNMLSFPYDLDEGERFERGLIELGPGITSKVITTGRPLRLGSEADQTAAGAIQIGGSDTQSWLGVPIPAGDHVIGVLGLESLQTDAYTEADERLLATLGASMGVALENARLFDETKRLLTETDQRAAELSLINEIGTALAAQLDFQAIIELVGERVRTLFDATSLFIGLYDPKTKLISFPYEIEEG